MIKMKRLLITLALTLSVVATTFALDSPTTVAVGCSTVPYTPYETGSGSMYAYGTFYCNTGGYHTYKTCILENNVVMYCSSIYTTTYSVARGVHCYFDGYPGPSAYKTKTYIYGPTGGFIMSATSGTVYNYPCS